VDFWQDQVLSGVAWKSRLGKAPENPIKPTLFAALQEQLGLKLEATRGPVSAFIIDHAEHASAN
jgi:uncharacterized protein (TIGR03435 family)